MVFKIHLTYPISCGVQSLQLKYQGYQDKDFCHDFKNCMKLTDSKPFYIQCSLFWYFYFINISIKCKNVMLKVFLWSWINPLEQGNTSWLTSFNPNKKNKNKNVPHKSFYYYENWIFFNKINTYIFDESGVVMTN